MGDSRHRIRPLSITRRYFVRSTRKTMTEKGISNKHNGRHSTSNLSSKTGLSQMRSRDTEIKYPKRNFNDCLFAVAQMIIIRQSRDNGTHVTANLNIGERQQLSDYLRQCHEGVVSLTSNT